MMAMHAMTLCIIMVPQAMHKLAIEAGLHGLIHAFYTCDHDTVYSMMTLHKA